MPVLLAHAYELRPTAKHELNAVLGLPCAVAMKSDVNILVAVVPALNVRREWRDEPPDRVNVAFLDRQGLGVGDIEKGLVAGMYGSGSREPIRFGQRKECGDRGLHIGGALDLDNDRRRCVREERNGG